MPEILSLLHEDSLASETVTSRLGRAGEDFAAEYLSENGYRMVVANFKVPVGRNSKGVQVTGEIDLVALEGDVLCFVEVKTRTSAGFASPTANVDLRKQRQITRTARVYRRIFHVGGMPYRYDVVSVILGPNKLPEIELFKGFWHESKFRKKTWNDGVFI